MRVDGSRRKPATLANLLALAVEACRWFTLGFRVHRAGVFEL